jgi:hypothetical protein
MTIVVSGLGRVIVVFPATLDSGVVTVGDVLVAVQESGTARHEDRGVKCGIEGSDTSRNGWSGDAG